MVTIEQALEDLDTLWVLQKALVDLDNDRQEAVLESYASDMQVYTLRYLEEDEQEVALESIGKLLKQGWDFIMNLIRGVYNFILRMFGGNPGQSPSNPAEAKEQVANDEDALIKEQRKALAAEAEAIDRKWAANIEKGKASQADNLAKLKKKYPNHPEHLIGDGVLLMEFGTINFTGAKHDSLASNTKNSLKKMKKEIESLLEDSVKTLQHNVAPRAQSMTNKIFAFGDIRKDMAKFTEILLSGLPDPKDLTPKFKDIPMFTHIVKQSKDKKGIILEEVSGEKVRYIMDLFKGDGAEFKEIRISKKLQEAVATEYSLAINTITVTLGNMDKMVKGAADSGLAIPDKFHEAIELYAKSAVILERNSSNLNKIITTFNKAPLTILQQGLMP